MVTVYLAERSRRPPQPAWVAFSSHDVPRRRPAPPLGRSRARSARAIAAGGLRRRRLALRAPSSPGDYVDHGRSCPSSLAALRLLREVPATAGALARIHRQLTRLRHPVRRLRAGRRHGDRPRARASVDAGADRRRDAVGAGLPRPVGARHRGPLRRRAGAGGPALRARRLDPPLVGQPARLGGAAQDAAHAGEDAELLERAGRRARVGAERARRRRSRPAAAPSARLGAEALLARAPTTTPKTYAEARRRPRSREREAGAESRRSPPAPRLAEERRTHLDTLSRPSLARAAAGAPRPRSTAPASRSSERRTRLLRFWSVISTPLLLVRGDRDPQLALARLADRGRQPDPAVHRGRGVRPPPPRLLRGQRGDGDRRCWWWFWSSPCCWRITGAWWSPPCSPSRRWPC